jgi:hypothetical protein
MLYYGGCNDNDRVYKDVLSAQSSLIFSTCGLVLWRSDVAVI